MKPKTKLWALSLASIGLALATSLYKEGLTSLRASSPMSQNSVSATDGSAGLVPDQETRSRVSGVQVGQVSFLRFSGTDFLEPDQKPIVVRDKRLIKQFIVALRYAEVSPLSSHLDMNTLEIHLNVRQGHSPHPIALGFQPHNPKYCFGPEFRAALGALGHYQSAERREQVNRLATHIHSIKVQVTTTNSLLITKPEDVHQLVQEMTAKETQFVDYTKDASHLWLTLLTKDGKHLQFSCLVEKTSAIDTHSSNLLQHYYFMLKPDIDPKTGQIVSKSQTTHL